MRNHLHQTLGDFSAQEVILQIRKARFSGEEEYFDSSDGRWKGIVTIPEFYDALIKQKLLIIDDSDSQPRPAADADRDSSVQVEAPEESPPQGTRTEYKDNNFDSSSSPPLESAQEATEFLLEPAEPKSESYNSLFSQENKGLRPDNSKLLSQPLLEEAPDANVAGEGASTPVQPARRKVLLIAGALILVTLYWGLASKKTNNPSISTNSSSPPQLSSNQEDLQIYWLKSAEQAYQMDLPPGYQAAAQFYQELAEASKDRQMRVDYLVREAMAIARTLQNVPQDQKLIQELQRVIQKGRLLAPQETGFYRAQAVAYHAQTKYDEAQKEQQRALETDPLNPANLLVEAEWMIDLDKPQEAQKLLKSVLAWSQQSIQANYLYALSCEKAGDLETAWTTSQSVLQLNPAHSPTYLLLADILSKKNDLKGAKVLYLLAGKFAEVSSKKVSGRAFWRAANLAELKEDAEEIKQLYQLSYHFSDEFKERILAKIKEAPTEQEIEKAKKTYLADPSYFELLGVESRDRKNFERAEGFYLAATWAFPRRAEFLLRLAEVREALARTREEFRWAVVSYEEAIRSAPNQAAAYVKLGLLETEQANFNRAFESLQKAEAMDPESADTQLALGKHLFARKDFRSAIERFQLARRINSGLSDVSYYQGKLYRLLDPQDTTTAMRHFEEAYSKDPQNYDAMAEWLKLKVITYEKMFAVKFLRNMLANSPKNADLLWVLGEVYSESQEFNKASQYYKKALDIDSQNSKVRLSLARALAKIGRLDEAIAEYTMASNLNAKNGEGYFQAADILYQGKRYQEAQDLILGLLKAVPNFPGARRLLAMTYQQMNKKDQAIEEMRKEARANPMNYHYSLELADLLITNEKFEEAVKELGPIINLPLEKSSPDSRAPSGYKREPTGLKPYRVRGLYLLARALRLLGRNEAAEGAIQTALKLEPDNLDLLLERGMTYHSLGRHLEAAKDFQTVLEKNPNIREAAQIKKIMKETVIEE